jgi:hypothetical protein
MNDIKSVVMLDSYDPRFNYSDNNVISLNPAVSYKLGKNQIDYSILEDFYSEEDLRKQDAQYFQEQMKWFDDFDDFIKNNIPYCKNHNIPLAKANYLRFKYVVDTIVINSKILEKYCQENYNVNKIIYIHQSYPKEVKWSIFKFKNTDRIVFGKILKLICAKHGIEFISKEVSSARSLRPSRSLHYCFTNHLKSFLKILIAAKKYNKTRITRERDCLWKDLKVFCMHAGSPDIDITISNFIKNKSIVYVKQGNDIIREDGFFRNRIANHFSNKMLPEEIRNDCKKCAQNISRGDKILSWINDKAGVDVTFVILPFLANFITEDIPYILKDVLFMLNFYKTYKIDYVFSRGNTDRDSQGALVAAKYMKSARCICMGHSSFAVDAEVYGVFEVETYDYLFTRDGITMDFFKNSILNRYKSECRILQSAHYLMSVERSCLKLKTSKKISRQNIVYVEKKLPDSRRHFNTMSYPLAWYFEFIKQIIDYFASEQKFNFIYKHAQFPGQEWANESISTYIKDKKCGNVSISYSPFIDLLKIGDRFIMDYPTGAFFEAALSQKPVLCIPAHYISIYQPAGSMFRKNIVPFFTIEDAILTVKNFLYSEPKHFIASIPLSRKSFEEVFNYEVLANSFERRPYE